MDPADLQRDDRAITRLAMAHDASHFLLTPTEVVTPRTVEAVAELLRQAVAKRTALTFRGAGTSLSGQGVTDSILVDVRRHFREIEVLDEGARVRAGAGATLAAVNARLARHGRRLGPDLTSEAAATVGGIVANNSSGMLAGHTQTAYRTLESMVAVLPSGHVIDTADPSADILLLLEETELIGGLHMLRRRLRENPDSLAEIERLFGMKNTMGYSINALVEFHRPADIVAHLLVGSEGTLGFIAEATFRTVPLETHSAAALALFPTLGDATRAVEGLVGHGFEAIELMDVAALRVVQARPNAPRLIRDADLTTQAALLIELYDVDEAHLAARLAQADAALGRLDVLGCVELTTERAARNALVDLRRSLYTQVAGARSSGTTTLLEDICVPLPQLTAMCEALDRLFDKHGYGILSVPLFAHARDGNIRFLLSERFDRAEGLIRYRKFSRDLAREVLRHGGVLKAEHGTGRAMAGFLERQYGPELHAVMREIKQLFDPAGVLNPGVLLTDDEYGHLTHLKLMPTIEAEVDRCIECGFCESICPSKDLTLTPRQRIVLRREVAARGDDLRLLAQIDDEEYAYAAVETCTVSGLCATKCPLGIDTGDLVRRQRGAALSRTEDALWAGAAKSWGPATRLGATALTVATSSNRAAKAATAWARKRLGSDPAGLEAGLPTGATLRRRPRRRASKGTGEVAAYFPACLGAMFGPTGQGTFSAFNELCRRAGVSVRLLDAEDLCCGSPWHAKGHVEGYETMRRKVNRALAGVQVPIVVDASFCTSALRTLTRGAHQVRDLIDFAADDLLPELTVVRRLPSLALHPTCGNEKLGNTDSLLRLARFIADEVVAPDSWGCCAFAGDRGMLYPELPASATAAMVAELAGRQFAAYASSNRTCELGMSKATGQSWVHIVELLAAATRPAEPGS